MPRLCESTASVLVRRLEAAEEYLSCILGRRQGRLSPAEVEVVVERLEECEDFVTLSPADWQRVACILLPEVSNGAFRDYSEKTLATWGRVCETVAPEEYSEPPAAFGTDELPGSHGKVCVMETRAAMCLPVCSARDASVGEDDAIVAEVRAHL